MSKIPSIRNRSGRCRRVLASAALCCAIFGLSIASAQEVETGAVGPKVPKVDLEKVATPRPDPVQPVKKDPLSSLGKLERIPAKSDASA
ncbi:MAG: hypothetical protein KDL87_15070, partial [Verrucomicrobiae bacterium]|nr:hypothetical protein [Verrucomicrobiae bacterium]